MRKPPRFGNSIAHFGWASIYLHWLSFIAITFLFFEGLYMVGLSYYDALYHTLPYWHKVVGLIVALFTALRLLILLLSQRPIPLAEHRMERYAAYTVHTLLYLCLILLLVSGYIITTGNGEPLTLNEHLSLPSVGRVHESVLLYIGDLHRWAAYGLATLVIGHSAAALKHHFIDKDDTLRRICFPKQHITQHRQHSNPQTDRDR